MESGGLGSRVGIRRRIVIGGIVQGVGFRPFVYRLASSLHMAGWVTNTSAGVVIEAEGEEQAVADFARRVREEAPPLARISSFYGEDLPTVGYRDFTIRESVAGPDRSVLISPDVAVCPDCRRELLDPADRRHRYPFINCVNCGPRYTIIRGVPYDRPLTSMASFTMCPDCRREYEDPGDRRFHAQPDACPACGPRLTLLSPAGERLADGEEAFVRTVKLLREGMVAAVKGIGGFHLAVDAADKAAVSRLRERKKREEKPFALMVRDSAAADDLCHLTEDSRRLLESVEAPIVLIPRRSRPALALAPGVAPRSRHLGIMLPSAPLHVLLMREFPVLVMTSGNLADEPLCADNAEAVERLGGIADGLLVHDRDIVLRCDDSIVRASGVVMRRARGFVPAPVAIPPMGPVPGPCVLCLGAEMKGSVCITRGDRAFIGQHLGDLSSERAALFLLESVRHLLSILEVEPKAVAHDLHPGYLTTMLAVDRESEVPWSRGLPVFAVQHHQAHLLSVQAENGLTGPMLGLALDGTGYGPDGTVWGGECLLVDGTRMERLGRLTLLWMPGGERAVREPYRMALSALTAALGPAEARRAAASLFPEVEEGRRENLLKMAENRSHGIATSSCGRLFDAFSAALGVCRIMRYEGQAAIELEILAEQKLTEGVDADILPFVVGRGEDGLWEADMLPAFGEAVRLRLGGASASALGGAFHRTLARALADMAARCWETAHLAAPGLPRAVGLSGGVMQNELLSALLTRELSRQGFAAVVHRTVPANDGGISLGQAVYARLALEQG
jgi:hydrogenase maturation protein HypF